MSSVATEHDSDLQPIAKPFFIGPLEIDPPILQAPMAGFTNYAFRQIVREFGGTGLQATEMVNARGFVWLDETRSRTSRPPVGSYERNRARWLCKFGTTNPTDNGQSRGAIGP